MRVWDRRARSTGFDERKGRGMSRRRIAIVAVSGALLAGGAGMAIAAVSKDDGKKAEQAVLDDAAKRLGVTADKLRDALSAAQDAQIDQAVKDGKLTQKQADAIKARRKQSGHVLGGPLGGPGPGGPGMRRFGGPGGPGFRGPGGPGGPGPAGPGGPGFGGHRAAVALDLAKALGLTEDKLHEQLRAGKSIADIAKAQGKSLADVRNALKTDAKAQADKAVKAGDLTQKQADELLSHLADRLDHLGDAQAMGPRLHRRGAPPPDLKGNIRPGLDQVPAPPTPDGVFS
jgi:polyhydroxyalkanoate synthesis regulator phasin